MTKKLIVPELNYWIKQVLLKSPINEKYFKIPSEISEYWKEPDSVLDLLFNENFISTFVSDPNYNSDLPEKPYIYIYRTCDIKSIKEKKLLNRLNIYRYEIDIYASDSAKFLPIFDQRNSPVFVNKIFEDENIQDHLEYLESTNDDMPSLPYTDEMDKKAQQNPYFTYKSKIYYSSNYQLVKLDSNYEFIIPPEEPILSPETNVFEFSEEEFMMLDLLYNYKTNLDIDISSINCSNLISPLSKCIFMYLSVSINGNFNSCPSDSKFSDGSNLLHSIYEKYVLDFIYRIRQKEYSVIYKPYEVINDELVEINQDYLLPLSYRLRNIFITDTDIQNNKIIIDDEYIPWDRVDFIIFHKGCLLKQDKDYKVLINSQNINNMNYEIQFLSDIFSIGDKLLCQWSYMKPKSAYNQNVPEEILQPNFDPSEMIEKSYRKPANNQSYITWS